MQRVTTEASFTYRIQEMEEKITGKLEILEKKSIHPSKKKVKSKKKNSDTKHLGNLRYHEKTKPSTNRNRGRRRIPT